MYGQLNVSISLSFIINLFSSIGVCIRGASIIAETNIVITNDAQYFIWEGHGLKFDVQKNSLPKGVSSYTLNIKASVSGQYELPKGYKLASAIYWVRSPGKFVKPVTVEIQHCARADENAKLSFVEAKCNQKDLPYTFYFSSGGTFTPQSSYGVISLSEFSGHGVAQEESGHENYSAQVYYKRRDDSWYYYFCLTKDLEICLTVSIFVTNASILYLYDILTLCLDQQSKICEDGKNITYRQAKNHFPGWE